MAQETNQTPVPMLCSTGCGFYGNPRTNGMCSICYKDFLQRQNGNGRVSPAASTGVAIMGESLPLQNSESSTSEVMAALNSASSPSEPSSLTSCQVLSNSTPVNTKECSVTEVGPALSNEELQGTNGSSQTSTEGQEKSPEKPKQRKNRCFLCQKKVGLTGFDCRCGNLFCSIHRYSDTHNCTFDYKADAAEKLRKENPVVVGEKIQKI
ncbi:AN1-type zinc finger protein 6 [Erpetoichthys calabaricus]|uniref:AN1-type zinc finger protein 6 n=1 Tax=Erpetoichthys calabaricus TaxID=27687 RepID=UPI00109F3013|nr:AN1-type zinc finger protein 6 [Erpetoichthys calabaricus]